MHKDLFYKSLLEDFSYIPTHGQKVLLYRLSDFVLKKENDSIFVVKGYAGTGKTTIVSTLVNALSRIYKRSVLLAPTGRAAKVLSSYSGKAAYTIHKKIYRVSAGMDGSLRLGLAPNKHTNTMFFVDEASMIPDSTGGDGYFSGSDLLHDLIEFIKSGKNNKLILIGDTAQLPPVGLEISPALDIQSLKNTFSHTILTYELKEVVRQSLESGILANATEIRTNLDTSGIQAMLSTQGFADVERINGELLEEALNHAYYGDSPGQAVVVTRSNKRANIFNQEIRNRILFRENEIASGDLLMVVKNNYYWVDKDSKPGFIANGDIVEIQKIIGYEDLYGFRFAEILIRLVDYPDEHEITVKILLDSMMADGPSISQQESLQFFEEVMKDYEDQPSRRKRLESVRNNPYYNALQVKFAYALTCHKTQGGQWESVFIDIGYLNEEHVNKSFYRWLYTAFTRATRKLFLVNFPDNLFK